MSSRFSRLDDTFKDFKSGDSSALEDILNEERPRLFDHIMRMCGQQVRAAELTDETMASVAPHAETFNSIEDLLVSIYKTARSFGRDVWNADTSRLENPAYSGTSLGKDMQSCMAIEVTLRSMPAIVREIILLKARIGFDFDKVAEISQQTTSEVEAGYALGLKSVEAAVPKDASRIVDLMGRLQPFSRPERDTPETQNLSAIMHDFQKANRLGSSTKFWVKWLVFGAVAATMYYFRADLMEFFLQFKG